MRIIGGLFRGFSLIQPKGQKIRPTSSMLRETLFNICQSYIEGAAFLDLFAGTGAVGLEALSRNAASVTFVDNSKQSIHYIKQNIKHLNVENQCQIIFGDAFQTIKKLAQNQKSFDIIFIDPPYSTTTSQQILETIDKHPGILKKNGSIFLESGAEEKHVLKNFSFKKLKKQGRSHLTEFVKFYKKYGLTQKRTF